MMRILILSLFLMITLSLSAGGKNTLAGARSSSLGHASVALSDLWSLQNNQAGLGFYRNLSASAYYENIYLTKKLSFKSIALAIPVRVGSLGIIYNHFGFENYNEMKFGLAFARAFGDKIAAGLQLDYLQTSLGDIYGKSGTITFEFGMQAKLNDNLNIGFHAFNPIKAKLTDFDDERIPTIFRLGAVYSFSENLLMVGEIEKDIENDPLFKVGTEYQFSKQFFARVGISTNPGIYSFGVGLVFQNFLIDLSSSMHPVLGYSPQASVTYIFNRNE